MVVPRSLYMVKGTHEAVTETSPLLSMGVATQEKEVDLYFIRRCYPHAGKSASAAPVLSGMQLTLPTTRRTPHVASPSAQAVSAASGKTRRAPSRHCTDETGSIRGHTTTDMYNNISTPLLHPRGCKNLVKENRRNCETRPSPRGRRSP